MAMYVQVKREARNGKQSLALSHSVQQLPIVNQPLHTSPLAQWGMSWLTEGMWGYCGM